MPSLNDSLSIKTILSKILSLALGPNSRLLGNSQKILQTLHCLTVRYQNGDRSFEFYCEAQSALNSLSRRSYP